MASQPEPARWLTTSALKTCPTCVLTVDGCARCGQSLTGWRWASSMGLAHHEHYHARCVTAEQLHKNPAAVALLFVDWEGTRS